MIGILAEKPSASRNFAKALGGMKGKYNNEDYIIVAARGHLYEFVKPHEMVDADKADKYKSWSVSNLPWDFRDFSWKREKKKDTAALLKSLKAELGACSEIVIATDVDPTGEGELLAYEILEELGLYKGKKISRMYFVDESEKEIQKAFVSRKIIPSFFDNADYRKALVRSKFDFLTMQFTRIATACGDGQSVIRQGRLKSAMVAIVGDGIAAVANYKKVPFYQNRFRDENDNVYSNPKEPSFPDKAQVPMTYKPSPVVLDKTERKSTAPKKLLDLAGLTALLTPKGFKAKEVLDVYQKLYEAQIVSYPRTEDKEITPEQFNELLPLADKIADVVGVDKSLLTHRAPRKTHVKAGGSHGANRPGLKVPAKLGDLSTYGACAPLIYELLAKSYLSMLAEDYIYDTEYGHVQNYPDFKASVSIPVSYGWKSVFNADDDDEDKATKHIGKTATPFVHEGFPPKPPQPTTKWLMQQLEKHDVGTGATRVSTYADVTSEKVTYPLLIEKKGKLSMAACGEMSYKLLPGTKIGDLGITEELQHDMQAVAENKITDVQCLSKIADYVMHDLKIMTDNGKNITKKAGSNMSEEAKAKYTGEWNGQQVSFTRSFGGYTFTDDECKRLCDGETIEIRGLVSAKTGGTYGVTGRLSNLEYNGHKYVGFEKLDFINDGVPSSWGGHKFTPEEKQQLEAGEEIQVDGLVSKKTGKTYSAKLSFDKDQNKIVPNFN